MSTYRRSDDTSRDHDTASNGQDLAPRRLNWKHVAILSMAGCGPASVIALNVHFMGTFAQASLVLAFVFVWPGILLLANTFSEFAKRLPTAGGLYTWNARAWGPNFGFVYGWTLIGSYLVFSSAAFAVLGGWINEWIAKVAGVNIPWWVFTVAGIAYLGIVQSLKAMLFFLATEMLLLIALGIWIVLSGGGPSGLTIEPFTIEGAGAAGIAGIALAMTYAVLSHVGVEEGATLGREMPSPPS